jgi:hypothetical protein
MNRKSNEQAKRTCAAGRRMPYELSRFAAPHTPCSPTDPPHPGGFARSGVKLPLCAEELRFEPAGRFRAGEQEREVPLGTLAIVDVRSLHVGWVRYRNDQPVAVISGFVGAGYQAPERADLGDLDPARWDLPDRDPWQQLCTLVLMSIPDMKSYSFITSRDSDWLTVLALISFWNKQKRLTKKLTLPVVRLQTLSRRKGMLDIHYPVFKIVGWAGGDDDGADAPKPKGDVPVVV